MTTETTAAIKLLDIPTERPAALPAVHVAPKQHLPAAPASGGGEAGALLQAIMAAASNEQVDIEKMERLFAMHERIKERTALEVFNDRMSAAQAEMAPVSADATNPQTKSRYASYAQLDRALRPIYTRHGFSVSFDTGEGAPADYLRVLAYVSCGGHTRTYRYDMPADGKGAKGGDVMTKTHAAGSAGSYGMRYLLKMIFNVAVGEDDDDGNGASGEQATRRTGESPDKPKDPVLLKGWEEAEKGLVALTTWWGALTPKQRSQFNADFGAMRKTAAKAGGPLA